MIQRISFITAHFYDFDWTNLLINNILSYTDHELIKEILIINQDRTDESHQKLENLCKKVRVLEYPKNEEHFRIQGHDHAFVLNQAIKEASGDFICIFDSDAHPINSTWVQKCNEIFVFFDSILALVPGNPISSHPCFMMLKRKCLDAPLSFDENLFTDREDTGRLIGKQLIENGFKVYFASSSKAFGGFWGNLYLDSIYHHKSATFYGASDKRITEQVVWQNKFFKHFVIGNKRYELTTYEYIKYRFAKKIHKFLKSLGNNL